MKCDAYSFIDLVTAGTALAALGLTIWTILVERRHNRASMMPHLSAWVDRKFSENGRALRSLEVEITNAGAGPAIIDSFEVMCDGAALDMGIGEMLVKVGGHQPFRLEHTELRFEGGDEAIGPGQRVRIVHCADIDCTALPGVLLKVRWRIRYRSIYGEKRTLEIAPNRGMPSR